MFSVRVTMGRQSIFTNLAGSLSLSRESAVYYPNEKLIILCMNTDDMLIACTDSARHLVTSSRALLLGEGDLFRMHPNVLLMCC
jgi:hypothetical protein